MFRQRVAVRQPVQLVDEQDRRRGRPRRVEGRLEALDDGIKVADRRGEQLADRRHDDRDLQRPRKAAGEQGLAAAGRRVQNGRRTEFSPADSSLTPRGDSIGQLQPPRPGLAVAGEVLQRRRVVGRRHPRPRGRGRREIGQHLIRAGALAKGADDLVEAESGARVLRDGARGPAHADPEQESDLRAGRPHLDARLGNRDQRRREIAGRRVGDPDAVPAHRERRSDDVVAVLRLVVGPGRPVAREDLATLGDPLDRAAQRIDPLDPRRLDHHRHPRPLAGAEPARQVAAERAPKSDARKCPRHDRPGTHDPVRLPRPLDLQLNGVDVVVDVVGHCSLPAGFEGA